MRIIWWLLCIIVVEVPVVAQQGLKRDYHLADSIARTLQGHSLDNIPQLTEELTRTLETDEEKFRAIYYWVCHNIENDYEGYETNRLKREKLKRDSVALKAWQVKFSQQQTRSLLQQRRTVCTGYTNLIRNMALHAGLECVSINGYGRTAQTDVDQTMVNHSWNAVRLDGNWYLCDATWSSGVVNAEERRFIPLFFEGYFLADPELFIRNHYPQDTSWTLSDSRLSLSEFLNRPLIYRAAYTRSLTDITPEVFRMSCTRNEEIEFAFRYAGEEEVKVTLAITGPGQNGEPRKPASLTQTMGQCNFAHRFTARGVFALHVLIDGDYAYTYEVTVR